MLPHSPPLAPLSSRFVNHRQGQAGCASYGTFPVVSPGLIFQEYGRSRSVSPAGYVSFYQPSSLRPAHFHGQLELLVVTRRQLSCLVGSRKYVARAPALIWHLPTVGHQTIEASPDCFFWVVLFEPFFAELVLSPTNHAGLGAGLARFGVPPRLAKRARGPFGSWILALTNLVGARPMLEISSRAADTINELGVRAVDGETSEQLTHALREILLIAVDESERRLSRLTSPSLSELGIALLLATPELKRDAMCRELNVSASYLARQFQRQAGATFAHFRSRARVVSFLAAVTHNGASLLQAALESGFGSYSQAHRVFSSLTGYCPSCYLESGGRTRLSEVTIESLVPRLGSPFRDTDGTSS